MAFASNNAAILSRTSGKIPPASPASISPIVIGLKIPLYIFNALERSSPEESFSEIIFIHLANSLLVIFSESKSKPSANGTPLFKMTDNCLKNINKSFCFTLVFLFKESSKISNLLKNFRFESFVFCFFGM